MTYTGQTRGRVPYGYDLVKDPKKGSMIRVKNDEQAKIVKEIFRRISQGDTVREIARDLDARGVPSPLGGAWEPSTVKRIGMQLAYIGMRLEDGRQIPINSPSIVTIKLFWKVYKILRDSTLDVSPRYLLSSLAECTECGFPLYHSLREDVHYYKCAAGCASIKMDWMDHRIEAVVVDHVDRDMWECSSIVEKREMIHDVFKSIKLKPSQRRGTVREADIPAIVAARVRYVFR